MTFEGWLFFMAIWIAVSVPLGPNALNCISATAAYGFKRGLWSVAGVFIAATIHMALALTGIAGFMTANPATFEVLRWLGVGYLAWMGVMMLRSKGEMDIAAKTGDFSRSQLVRRAVLISLSNPKAIFVWLAVFSQFISTTAPLGAQLIVLAPSALLVTLVVYTGYCILGLALKRVFTGSRKRWFDRIAGSIYLGFALGLASSDLRKT